MRAATDGSNCTSRLQKHDATGRNATQDAVTSASGTVYGVAGLQPDPAIDAPVGNCQMLPAPRSELYGHSADAGQSVGARRRAVCIIELSCSIDLSAVSQRRCTHCIQKYRPCRTPSRQTPTCTTRLADRSTSISPASFARRNHRLMI